MCVEGREGVCVCVCDYVMSLQYKSPRKSQGLQKRMCVCVSLCVSVVTDSINVSS